MQKKDKRHAHYDRWKREADARFAPHREAVIRDLLAYDKTRDEIMADYPITHRHMNDLINELGLSMAERGKAVLAKRNHGTEPTVKNVELFKQHALDFTLSAATIMDAHQIMPATYEKFLLSECGMTADQRYKRYVSMTGNKRNTFKEKQRDCVARTQQMNQSMSGNGMSLALLKSKWTTKDLNYAAS